MKTSLLKFGACVALLSSILGGRAHAAVMIFECEYPSDSFGFVITVYDDGSPARIGVETGVGSLGQTWFDELTKTWAIIEFIENGNFPTTFTTIMADGTAFHSRHTIDAMGIAIESQMQGNCARRKID